MNRAWFHFVAAQCNVGCLLHALIVMVLYFESLVSCSRSCRSVFSICLLCAFALLQCCHLSYSGKGSLLFQYTHFKMSTSCLNSVFAICACSPWYDWFPPVPPRQSVAGGTVLLSSTAMDRYSGGTRGNQ